MQYKLDQKRQVRGQASSTGKTPVSFRLQWALERGGGHRGGGDTDRGGTPFGRYERPVFSPARRRETGRTCPRLRPANGRLGSGIALEGRKYGRGLGGGSCLKELLPVLLERPVRRVPK